MDGSKVPPNAPLATIPAPIMPPDLPFLLPDTFIGVLHNSTACTPTSGHPRNTTFTTLIAELLDIIIPSLPQISKVGGWDILYDVSETENCFIL